MFLLNLEEIDRVKRLHNIQSVTGLQRATKVNRRTWHTALGERRPTQTVLQALAKLGARADQILVDDEPCDAV